VLIDITGITTISPSAHGISASEEEREERQP
jgi:hypothetical protein